MKKALILVFAVWYLNKVSAQSKFDSIAVLIIDRMTDVIGDLRSCSFKLNSAIDIQDVNFGWTKNFTESDVYLSGNNKMLVNSHGHKGHRQFWYNGSQLAYYSFEEHHYGILPAPATTLKMIDSINSLYTIEFPAADFFYPAFTDDLLESSDSLRYAGLNKIAGEEYFHIIAYNKEKTVQFWITNDAWNLPARFVVTYKSLTGSPQYLALFSNWKLNPDLPPAMFDFLPPPSARVVRIFSKNDR